MSIHRLTIVLAIAATICGGANAQSPIKCATNKQCETPDTGLACIHNTCGQCNTTNQTTNPCGSTHVCAFDIDQAIHTCKRAPLFSEATPVSTWFGVVFLFMGSALAAGGGLGGGGIFVPLLILVATLSPKEAVPISQAMIFGGSLVNLYINYHSRHPTVKTRPLIDYDAVLILEPLMLLGTTIGVMLNTICPTWLIVVILVVVIGYGAIRTTKKGIRKFNQERALRAAVASRKQEGIEMTEQVAKKDGNDGELSMPIESKENIHGPMMTRMGKGTMVSHRPKDDMCVIELEWKLANNAKVFMYTKYSTTVESGNTSVNNTREPNVSASKDVVVGVDVEATDALQRQKTLIVERESTQNSRLLMVMGMLILIVILSLIRGGKAGAASVVGIETCSGGYWGVTIALFLVLIILAVVVGTTLKSQYDAKIACKYTFVEGDIEWTGRNVYLYPALSAFAGMCGGLLGIGGGMIMGPLLLELKMLPECTQATSATTVMITSGAAMFQFLFLGMLIPDYGLAFTIVGFIATFFGQTALNYLVKKYNTTSFIVFSIALVMIIAVLLMAVAGIIRIVDEVENGGGGFSSMC